MKRQTTSLLKVVHTYQERTINQLLGGLKKEKKKEHLTFSALGCKKRSPVDNQNLDIRYQMDFRQVLTSDKTE